MATIQTKKKVLWCEKNARASRLVLHTLKTVPKKKIKES